MPMPRFESCLPESVIEWEEGQHVMRLLGDDESKCFFASPFLYGHEDWQRLIGGGGVGNEGVRNNNEITK